MSSFKLWGPVVAAPRVLLSTVVLLRRVANGRELLTYSYTIGPELYNLVDSLGADSHCFGYEDAVACLVDKEVLDYHELSGVLSKRRYIRFHPPHQ